jgi:hypothetical protein
MKLTYTLTLNDYKAGISLHKHQKLGRRIHFFIYDVIFPSIAIVALLGTVAAYAYGQSDLVDDLIVPDAALACIAILVPLLRAYRIRKSYKQLFPPGRLDRNWSIDIDDERIVSSISGVCESKVLWTGVFAFVQDDKITSLYISENQYISIPTGALTPDQRTELYDLIARNVVRKQK